MPGSWLPPRPRGAGPPPVPRIRTLDPSRPALRLVTIALLTVLLTLLVVGIAWAVLLPG